MNVKDDIPRPGSANHWAGTWVADRLGLGIRTTDAPLGVQLDELVGLAVRRNPRRAHLLVSTVLGKHVPTDPNLVYGAGLLLGGLVARALTGHADAAHPRDRAGGNLLRRALAGASGAAAMLADHGRRLRETLPLPEGVVVLGYAETATALGHVVADALDAPTLHSTRRPVAGVTSIGGFEEEHSHATSHLLLPEDPTLLAGIGPLVLVDDELSTGTTALNTIAELHALDPRTHYVIAALVDLRSGADQSRIEQTAADLGARIDVVALAAGRVDLPEGVLAAGQELVATTEALQDSRTGAEPSAHDGVTTVALPSAAGVRDGGRHGFTPTDRRALEHYLAEVAATTSTGIEQGPVHVLGFEELMYAPLRLAQALSTLLPHEQITYSTTTRSPILAVADDGYAIRSRIVFPAHDDPADGPGDRYAYNVAPATTSIEKFGTVVLVIDAAADTPELHAPAGLLAKLAEAGDRVVLVVIPDYRPTISTLTADTTTGEDSLWPRPMLPRRTCRPR
ncbi:phosphoribosyltransferase family protein [Nocardioides sp. URHA0032]|uniref:phosphoribosyltransferase family protein n=1 Tax=Nocardioides sp. URHA0032 TaxID=1380388 RepID=UPI000B2A7D2F|nr:phosphoribosyltransferase family protein [Nocardioides sp. URHA0032]